MLGAFSAGYVLLHRFAREKKLPKTRNRSAARMNGIFITVELSGAVRSSSRIFLTTENRKAYYANMRLPWEILTARRYSPENLLQLSPSHFS